ncbi:hypothetical protein, partial [Dysgonomonas sp. ZJ279]|uniref:hypothetical protein n=1 Tax=Dysgonomonas sp. ZJ279 TaxID=2709796 RepID=UPI0013ECB9C3
MADFDNGIAPNVPITDQSVSDVIFSTTDVASVNVDVIEQFVYATEEIGEIAKDGELTSIILVSSDIDERANARVIEALIFDNEPKKGDNFATF